MLRLIGVHTFTLPFPGRGAAAEAQGAGGAGEEGGEKNGGRGGSEEDPLGGGADRHPQQEAVSGKTGA